MTTVHIVLQLLLKVVWKILFIYLQNDVCIAEKLE